MNNFTFQNKIKNLNFKGIFKPTDTTRLLVNASQKYLKKNQRVLDLGCGGGVITYLIYNKKLNQKYYLSDLHSRAIERSRINLKKKNISAVLSEGSLYEPWNNFKFDLIINDVSGISSEIARISSWFKDAPSDKAKSGISNLKKILKTSNKYMNKNSIIIFPVISLSNVNQALKEIKNNFKIVDLKKYYWPMPKTIIKKIKLLNDLKKKGHIRFEMKYNMFLCYTLIAVCKNK